MTRIFPVQHNRAADLAPSLQRIFDPRQRSSQRGGQQTIPAVITYDAGSNTLLVSATAEDLAEIDRLLKTLDTPEAVASKVQVKSYALTNASAAELARSLARLFAQQGRGGRSDQPQPRFEAEANSNQLVVAATDEQFKTIDQLIQRVQQDGDLDETVVKHFPLKHAQADQVAPTLTRIVQAEIAADQRRAGGRTRRSDFQISPDERTNALLDHRPGADDEGHRRAAAQPLHARSRRQHEAGGRPRAPPQERLSAGVRGRGQYGKYKYSRTILPGIFSYIVSYVEERGAEPLKGSVLTREYGQHRYNLKYIHSAPQKNKMVEIWNKQRYPTFKRNLDFNLAMLEQLLIRCRERGLHPVLVELPNNRDLIGRRLDHATAEYQKPAQASGSRVRCTVRRLQPGARAEERRLPRPLSSGGARPRDLAAPAGSGAGAADGRRRARRGYAAVKIYFTLYLIPVVIVALLVFWLALRNDRNRLIFVLVLSVAVLGVLNPAFAAIAVGLVLVTHQLVELKRQKKLSGGRAVFIIIAIAVITRLASASTGSAAPSPSGRGRLGRLASHHALGHQLLRLPPSAVRLRLPARRDRRELLPAAGRFRDVHPTLPGGPSGDVPGFLREAQLPLRPPALLLRPAAHRARLLQEGLCGRLRLRDLLRQADQDHRRRPPSIRPKWARGGRWPTASSSSYAPTSTSPRYTDLAIGFSSLFGFRIMENFHLPFLQKNLGDFWRSWHISLSSWCRNNVYFPVLRPHPQGVARPLRQHADHGTVALHRPQLGRLGPLSRYRAGDRLAL